jgi:hypothetical protein
LSHNQLLGLEDMEITFIIALYHIEISEPLGKGDNLDDITFISNDPSISKGLVPTGTRNIIGQLEYNGLLDAKAFIYSKEEIPDASSPEEYLIDRLYFVQSFLSSIWLKIDNSVGFELGFVFYKKNEVINVSSNFLAVAYTNSNVEQKECVLNRHELRSIRSLNRDKLKYIKDAYKDIKETQLLKKNTRVDTSLYHILGARAESDIGVKISHYCSALEALFSTSQAELAHQLSERLSFCISKTPEERFENYKKSKQAYAVRSKVVHGAHVKEIDLPKIRDSAVFCDSSLRIVLLKILTNEDFYKVFTSGNELLDSYMLKLIFGINEQS